MALYQLFIEHPEDEGMSYCQHWLRAMEFCFWSVVMACTAFVHAWVPGLFVYTTTNRLRKLAEQCQPK